MLVPTIAKPLLTCAGFALILVAMFVLVRRLGQPDLPVATVVGSSRGLARRWPWLFALGGLAITYTMCNHTTAAIVITDDDHGMRAERKIWIWDDATPDVGDTNLLGTATWVLNRSTRAVYVARIDYGSAANTRYFSGSWSNPSKPTDRDLPTMIAPNATGLFYDIDYIGPDDPPPALVRSASGATSRSWLTWERDP